ncbi:methyltransferase domain-containing protein [Halobacteria archaeon HArc-gm2]|nr:methyltransferase domain-containing protein [Halobacteria archaeon HArc-gm2]
MSEDGTANRWDAGDYDGDHAFVHEMGASVVDLLDPAPGERVLDLGCGTGHLTAEITAAVGDEGHVVGVDQSAEMVAEAREQYPGLAFERADATEFASDEPFDAVFSNAALHWMTDQDAVVERVADALRRGTENSSAGGRFVAEMGGRGNVATIVDATIRELTDRGYEASSPWYFPTVGEQASLLERHGFEVRLMRLFDRPTELDGGRDGLRNWLGMFGDSLLAGPDEAERRAVVAAVEDRCRDALFDAASGTWTADYRRLRFEAVRTTA